MSNETEIQAERRQNIRTKNLAMLLILLAVIGLLYGLSFVKFGEAVSQQQDEIERYYE